MLKQLPWPRLDEGRSCHGQRKHFPETWRGEHAAYTPPSEASSAGPPSQTLDQSQTSGVAHAGRQGFSLDLPIEITCIKQLQQHRNMK